MSPEEKKEQETDVEKLMRVVSGKKKLREMRKRDTTSFWDGVAMLGLIGWMIMIPTLIGIFVGRYLDDKYEQEFSWTITLMVLGLFFGGYNALRSMFESGRPKE